MVVTRSQTRANQEKEKASKSLGESGEMSTAALTAQQKRDNMKLGLRFEKEVLKALTVAGIRAYIRKP